MLRSGCRHALVMHLKRDSCTALCWRSCSRQLCLSQRVQWSCTFSAVYAVVSAAGQINNFEVPTSLEGLSLGTIILALVGNGLMVPRAMFTRDSIWLLGSAWGSTFGWLQLLSMFVGRSAAGCDSLLAIVSITHPGSYETCHHVNMLCVALAA